jgi:hypothetical protein
MLEDTERRDKTQVMFKQHRRRIPNVKDREELKQKSPVIMVDQLWLWVLEDERTVITSFPNTWVATENYNLMEHLLKKELKGHPSDRPLDRPLIGAENSMDLANAIIRGSVSFLERVGPSNARLAETFQSSITMIVSCGGSIRAFTSAAGWLGTRTHPFSGRETSGAVRKLQQAGQETE